MFKVNMYRLAYYLTTCTYCRGRCGSTGSCSALQPSPWRWCTSSRRRRTECMAAAGSGCAASPEVPRPPSLVAQALTRHQLSTCHIIREVYYERK